MPQSHCELCFLVMKKLVQTISKPCWFAPCVLNTASDSQSDSVFQFLLLKIFRLIVHQIFGSRAIDLDRSRDWISPPHSNMGNIRVIILQSSKPHVLRTIINPWTYKWQPAPKGFLKFWMVNLRYLFLDDIYVLVRAHSFLRASSYALGKLFASRKRYNMSANNYPSIFPRQMAAVVLFKCSKTGVETPKPVFLVFLGNARITLLLCGVYRGELIGNSSCF